ncbi:PAS domain S-box-containing protein [Desulfonauticus submarinus]|uniref:histidine kinase n=1 Tax=Desulfonauticus submarinus TaxID=206665 RepID=A0A1H0FG12_9BACT|nr:ATP-binding protein [Desulfonauticus submarinus]SDN93718.1 PAS domain S-box-containing protein [Desulfonauticus submarinus]
MNKLKNIYFSRLPFRTKITYGLSLLLLFCGLSVGYFVTQISEKSILWEHYSRGKTLVKSFAYRTIEPLLARNYLQLQKVITELKKYPEFTYAYILDEHKNILIHSFDNGFPLKLLQINAALTNEISIITIKTNLGLVDDFGIKITLKGEDIGYIHLGLNRHGIAQILASQRRTAFFTTLGIIFLGIFLAHWFSQNITRRLETLKLSADEIIKGNLDVQAGPLFARNCWDIMHCKQKNCPAYKDTRRRCWHLVGTLCENCSQEGYPSKLSSCVKCKVYQQLSGDEVQDLAEVFDVMALSLKNYISEIRNQQKELKRQENLLRTIVNTTPDFITFQDIDLKYQMANKAFCDYFKTTERDVLGKTDFDIFSPEQADHNYHEDKQIFLTKKPLSKEIQVRKGKQERWFHVLKVPVFEGDKMVGLLLTARDITMLKKYQEQLLASQKMEHLGRLAGGVAHEINTPLSIILGYTQLLLEDVDNPQWREDLKTIEKQTKVCRKIVADLLRFSRQGPTEAKNVDLNASLKEVVSLIEHTFSLSHVTILTNFDSSLPPIKGDGEKLKQVWLNLLNNALDAIGENGYIFIRTKLCAHRRRIVVHFLDTGSGIPQENLDKIFDPFFTTKEVGKGTGLGLSVTFGIIRDHGGRIFAYSPPPVEYLPKEDKADDKEWATIFIIELPLKEEKLPDDLEPCQG